MFDVAQEAVNLRTRMLMAINYIDPNDFAKQMLEEGLNPQAVRWALAMVKMEVN
jgi:hypothetical protein